MYAGAAAPDVGARRRGRPRRPPVARRSSRSATRIYVNLAIADHAEEVAALPVDGVGLLRAEFMVTDALGGRPPAQLLADGGRRASSSTAMAASLLADHPRLRAAARRVPHHRLPHATSSAGLEGGDAFEPVEDNPMIGYRGCFRYVREPDLFALELELLARVREETPEPAPDDPVRAHPVGARGVPRGDRRQPARPPARVCTAG